VAMSAHHLEIFAVLAALSLSYSVLVRHVERLRRGLTEGNVANSLDVWIMAGALLLPASLLTALVLLVYVAEWPSRKIVDGGRPRRYVISIGVNLLAALTGAAVHELWVGPLGLLAMIFAWLAVNDALIAAVMVAGGSGPGIRRLLSPRNHVFDLATKFAGIGLAPLLEWHIPVAAAILPLFLLGHRIALHDSIRETAAFDSDSGLWSEKGWRIEAERVAMEAPASVVMMLIDPTAPEQEVKIRASLITLFSLPIATGGGARPVHHVLGRYGTRQVALLCEVDVEGVGALLAKHVRDRLKIANIACVVGASVGSGMELDELVMRAGEDLMRRRAQAGVSVRW